MSHIPNTKKPFFQSDAWLYIRWIIWLPLTYAAFGLSMNLGLWVRTPDFLLPFPVIFGFVGLVTIFCVGFFAPRGQFVIALVVFVINLVPIAYSLIEDFSSQIAEAEDFPSQFSEALGTFVGLCIGLLLVRLFTKKPTPAARSKQRAAGTVGSL